MLWEGRVWEEPCGGPPHFFDRTDLRRCTRSAPVAPLFRDRHRTGSLDQLAGSGRGSLVEECLGCGRQGLAGLGHQHEGPLNGVAAVQNSFLRAGHAAYGDGLDGVLTLYSGEGCVTDGVGVAASMTPPVEVSS